MAAPTNTKRAEKSSKLILGGTHLLDYTRSRTEDEQPIKVYLPWRVIHSPSLKMDLYNGPAKLASYSLEEMREKLRKLLASTYGEVLVMEVDSQK